MEVDTLEYGRIELEKPKCSGFPAAQNLHRRMDALEGENAILRQELGLLRQEMADERNALQLKIAMQIESYMIHMQNND